MMTESQHQSALCKPERFAQEALGHNSKAVHRAYAKRALMKIPSLEDYEQKTLLQDAKVCAPFHP